MKHLMESILIIAACVIAYAAIMALGPSQCKEGFAPDFRTPANCGGKAMTDTMSTRDQIINCLHRNVLTMITGGFYPGSIDQTADAILALFEPLTARVAELEATLNNIQCVWANAREDAYADKWEVLENEDPGNIVEIDHVVVAKTTFNVFLDSDDDLEIDEWNFEGSTLDETTAALEAEIERRKSLGIKP